MMIKGPLTRIKVDIAKIIAGDLRTRITLRGNDEFKDFANELNAMTAELNKKFVRIDEAARRLGDSVDALKAQPEVKDNVRQNIAELETSISVFKK
jgi:methyl-accepting chemotaxis protein